MISVQLTVCVPSKMISFVYNLESSVQRLKVKRNYFYNPSNSHSLLSSSFQVTGTNETKVKTTITFKKTIERTIITVDNKNVSREEY